MFLAISQRFIVQSILSDCSNKTLGAIPDSTANEAMNQ
jgi:hypothetical protein